MRFRRIFCLFTAVLAFAVLPSTPALADSVSSETKSCIVCHRSVTPGIVADWEASRHSRVTPAEGMEKSKMERRISVSEVDDALSDYVVGCAECHTINADAHSDSFEHQGFQVHSVVTPQDCGTCHPVEVSEYSKNIMSQAHANLNGNPVYHDLVNTSIGTQKFSEGKLSLEDPNELTSTDACNYCHGTEVEFQGLEERQTSMGEMKLPKYKGWPNQGVGRVNPDGTKGSCSSCHSRHEFSIAMARKPYTCKECHKGPDVPAYKVYMVSKHGNIFSSEKDKWDFNAVPWTVGEDFTAPTCAECHASLVVTPDGEVLAERTHQFNDRLKWRIFGVPYAQPHPIDPDTTKIKNRNDLPLSSTLSGEPASEYLIDENEQEIRQKTMKKVCSGCHSDTWIRGHFERFENTVRVTNEKTLTATNILLEAYDKGLADNDNLFDEAIEKKWVESWLFFSNSIRFSSAMAGADYGVFANGRWWLNKNIAEMEDYLDFLKATHEEHEEHEEEDEEKD